MDSFERIAREFIESRLSPATRGAYRADLARWLEFCCTVGADPGAPELGHATAFRNELLTIETKKMKPKPLSALSKRRIMSSLSAVYRWAMDPRNRAASWNPFEAHTLPRPKVSDYFATKEIPDNAAQRVVEATELDTSTMGARDSAILHLLRATGLRRASVAQLRRADLIRKDGLLAAVHVLIKGGKRKTAQLNPAAAAAVARWLLRAPSSTWLFPNSRDTSRAIGPTVITQVVRDRAKAAGCPHLHPHQFRVAFITDALDAGVPLADVQAAAHHEDPKTTLRYDRGARGVGVVDAVAKFRKDNDK